MASLIEKGAFDVYKWGAKRQGPWFTKSSDTISMRDYPQIEIKPGESFLLTHTWVALAGYDMKIDMDDPCEVARVQAGIKAVFKEDTEIYESDDLLSIMSRIYETDEPVTADEAAAEIFRLMDSWIWHPKTTEEQLNNNRIDWSALKGLFWHLGSNLSSEWYREALVPIKREGEHERLLLKNLHCDKLCREKVSASEVI